MADDFIPSYIQSAPLPATVKIADADAPDGFVIINAAEFDAETMTLFGTEPKAPRRAKAAE